MKRFAPTINVEGRTVTPKGYLWVLGFALGGCDWAIKEASKPEFINEVRADLVREKVENLEKTIQHYENRIAEMKNEIDGYV